jgi:hypothetical protein
MRTHPFVALVWCLSSIFAFGQATTSLTGTVTDPSGAVVPGATLTLTNTGTNLSRETISDSEGRYTFTQVQPGSYTLTGKAAGFNDVIVNDIRLLVNTPATIPVVFEKIGAVATTVAVSAEAIQVNTTDASIGNAIGDRPITQLPFEARNVVGLLSLQPGVVYLGDPNPGQLSDYRSGSVNGGKSDQANVTLDGVDVNDQQARSAFTSVLRVTLDSVQEFRTITTNAGADFGRTSGAQVTLVTKSGTNTLHGSLYEYLRNTKTSANEWFNNRDGIARPKLNRNVFGVSIGGPVKPNRLFFFLNYEGRRDRSETPANQTALGIRVVPTADFRQGIFTYQRKDGSTGKLSPAQVKALDPLGIGANPAVLQLLQSYPLPNSNAAGDLLNTAGYNFNASTPLDWNTYIAKFDWSVDADGKHRVFWRGNLQNDDFANGIPQFPGDPPSRKFLENSKGLAFGYTAVLTSNLISNFHYGLTRQGQEFTGLQSAAAARFRDITERNATTREQVRITPVHQFSEDLSWIKGAHNVAVGGVVRLIRNRRSNTLNSFSDALANSSFLLGSGADFLAPDAANTLAYRRQFTNLLGILTQLTGQYNYDLRGNLLPEGILITRKFYGEEYEFYLQDTWKATRALSLTAGVRVSLFPPVYEAQGYQVSSKMPLGDWWALRASLAAQGRPQSEAPPVEMILAGSPGGRPLYPYQHDVAPRFALAYSPQGTGGLSKLLFGGPDKTSIRAGFGIFYDLFGQTLASNYDATALGFSTEITNPATATITNSPRFTGYYNVPFNDPMFPKGPATSTFPQLYPDVFAITNSIDDRLRAPYTMNLDFSIQRDLGRGFMVQASYIGRLSRRSLIKDDLAMPTNLVDPKSGMNYRQAAGLLTAMINRGVPVDQVAPIAYFENLWPGAAGDGRTATQNIYDLYESTQGDYTTGLLHLDMDGGALCCSILGPNAIFNSQFGSLAALRSRGKGYYHAMQWTLRKRFSAGVQFDFNYTYAKSIDLGSLPERTATEIGDQINSTSIINSWYPNDMKAVSDYDVQHLFSAFWVVELPFGRGKPTLANAGALLNNLLGGWSVNGVFRNSSGLPVSVTAGGVWPTNWQVGSNAIQTGVVPATHTTKNAPPAIESGESRPNLFADPSKALAGYGLPLAGDSGQRNGIRGDGFFGIDLGVGKRFHLFDIKDQPHTLQFRAESFNITNSVRFDPATANLNILDPVLFGQYTTTLTRPRVFQFSLRYEF